MFTKSFSQTLDQHQDVYNGGTSARNLPGYSEWQSFTAGLTGTLSKIKMGFFNYINGSGTLKIFSGTGTAGPLLQSQVVTVYVASGNVLITFNTSVSVTAGSVYTFQFIPGSGIPDPYGVQVQVPGTYAGGYMAIVDPSGTYNTGFDLVFQTYVTTSLPIKLVSFDASLYGNSEVKLDWVTASEVNNDYFTVEKSIDAIGFEEVAVVAGAGNSFSSRNYSLIDAHPFPGTSYYRLKQTDFNGEVSYSKVAAVKTIDKLMNLQVIFSGEPNSLRIIVHCNESVAQISLIDVRGRIVFTKSISANTPEEINTTKLASGVYMLLAAGEKERCSQKILIQ